MDIQGINPINKKPSFSAIYVRFDKREFYKGTVNSKYPIQKAMEDFPDIHIWRDVRTGKRVSKAILQELFDTGKAKAYTITLRSACIPKANSFGWFVKKRPLKGLQVILTDSDARKVNNRVQSYEGFKINAQIKKLFDSIKLREKTKSPVIRNIVAPHAKSVPVWEVLV